MSRTVGVEEEFLLVSRTGVGLDPVGEQVAATAGERSDGQFEHELKLEQAELGTDPCAELAELERQLRDRRRVLADSARTHGADLAALGTCPIPVRDTVTPNRRYERMVELFGEVAAVQLTCGMHLHIDIDSPDEGVGIIDRLRIWLPLLIAISGNSPFWRGRDTTYASYRTQVWRQWPTAGPTEIFGDHDHYRRVRQQLIDSGGAMDEGMIYFDARLSASYPTVEIRVADVCPLVDDAVTIAGLARALVETAATDHTAGLAPPACRTEVLKAASWRASRFGVRGELVDPLTAQPQPAGELLDRLIETVSPALERTGDRERVVAGLAEIVGRGTGADRQRAAYERSGSWSAVMAAIVADTLR